MTPQRTIQVPVEHIRRVAFGLANFQIGDQARDLAIDLMQRWNPALALAALGRMKRDDIQIVDATTLDGLFGELNRILQTELVGCDLIIQHGEFALKQESTNSVVRTPLALGVFVSTGAEVQNVRVVAGMDTSLVPGDRSRVDALIESVPAREQEKLLRVRNSLANLEVTDPKRGEDELEAHNISRRTVWGDRAAVLPIERGTADEVFAKLASCIATDFRSRQAKDIAVEEIAAVSTSEVTAGQLERLSPTQRQDFEQRLAKRQSGEKPRIRKYVVSVNFPNSFGKHDILRIGENEYLGMACSVAEAPAFEPPAPREAAPRPEPALPRKRSRKKIYIAVGVILFLSAVGNIIGLLRQPSRKPQIYAAGLTTPIMVTIGEELVRIPAAIVEPIFFEPLSGIPEVNKVRLAAGRGFRPEDVDVMVISDSLWRQRFGASPDVLGKQVTVDGRKRTVVGVMMPGNNFPAGALLWLPDERR